jgi:hypothetical protein
MVSLLVNHLTHTKSATVNQIHIQITTMNLVSSPELKITGNPTIRDTTEQVNMKTHSISRPKLIKILMKQDTILYHPNSQISVHLLHLHTEVMDRRHQFQITEVLDQQ